MSEVSDAYDRMAKRTDAARLNAIALALSQTAGWMPLSTRYGLAVLAAEAADQARPALPQPAAEREETP